jgi:hypothetical protein
MKPNVREEVLSGVGAQELELSSQYLNNAITIIGLDTGTMIVRAKASDNPAFEDVINGEILLYKNRTLTIRNTQLDALEFTITPEAAYTVRVKQTDGDTER